MVLTGAIYDADARTIQFQLAGMDASSLPLPPGVPAGRDDLQQVTPTRVVSPAIPLAGRGTVTAPTVEYQTPDGQLWRYRHNCPSGVWYSTVGAVTVPRPASGIAGLTTRVGVTCCRSSRPAGTPGGSGRLLASIPASWNWIVLASAS